MSNMAQFYRQLVLRDPKKMELFEHLLRNLSYLLPGILEFTSFVSCSRTVYGL